VIGAAFGASQAGILVAVIVLVACSGLLAVAETSLVSITKARARSLAEDGRRSAKTLERLVDNPQNFLGPVLFLVLVCQLVAATLVTVIATTLFGSGKGSVAAVVFEIVVIFLVAESIPKNWAVQRVDRAALLSAPIISALIAFPPIRAVSSLMRSITDFVVPLEESEAQPDVTESELLAMADVAFEADVIEAEERVLLNSIIEFGDTIVREVMVPRPDVVAVESTLTCEAVLERAIGSGLSRIPIYTTSIDDITGVAFTRDLVKASWAKRGDEPVSAHAREPRYVPETKRVAPLLREMQREQFHLAVVVDEYGVTAGIVTLEDLIEELVGEIEDEYDHGAPEIETISPDEMLIPGEMAIDEVNEVLDVELPEGDWDTIGGLVFHLAGHVPREGDRIVAGPYDLVVERVQGRRIRKIRLIRTASAADAVEERSS
jgi:CBS domain containing-hemolysin-like protein